MDFSAAVRNFAASWELTALDATYTPDGTRILFSKAGEYRSRISRRHRKQKAG